MNLRDFYSMVRGNWVTVLAATLIGLAAASGLSLIAKPTYESTAAVYVSTESAVNVTDLSVGSSYVQQIVKSYATIATSPLVLNRVGSALTPTVGGEQLSAIVTADAPLDTAIINITATTTSASQAAEIANLVAKDLQVAVRQVSPTESTAQANIRVTTIQPATAPLVASSPNWKLNLGIGFAGGALAGLIVAALAEAFNTRIRSVDEVSAVTDLPILGNLPYDETLRAQHVLDARESAHSSTEAYQRAKANIQYLSEKKLRSLVISSSVASEGKSTAAVNLAQTFAASGEKVILVDGDLRRPSVATYLGLDAALGLSEVLVGHCAVHDAIQKWGEGTLWVLPSGTLPPNPVALLESSSMRDVITGLLADYDRVIIDAPPVLPVTDSAVLSRVTDGIIVVVANKVVRKQELFAALRALHQVDAPALGVIYAMSRQTRSANYYYSSMAAERGQESGGK